MNKNYRSSSWRGTVILLIIGGSFLFYSFSTGITNVTLKNGNGCDCHNPTPTAGVNVVISGPDTLLINQTAAYTVTISGGPLAAAGTNIAASNGTLANTGSDLQVMGDELTHTLPKQPTAGQVVFSFNYTAPPNESSQTLYANGNSVNLDGNNTGDQWNFAVNKTVVVLLEIPVEMQSFSASVLNNEVNLIWSTATEANNKGFEVYKYKVESTKDKVNEADWQAIGFVEGKGNSTEINNYSFNDRNVQPGTYNYRIKQIDYDGSYEYHGLQNEVIVNVPDNFIVSQNYPNPFNPATKIDFVIPVEANVSIVIYNSLGVEINELINGRFNAGYHSIDFNAEGLSSGVYYYKISASNSSGEKEIFSSVKKMVILK